MIRTSPGRSGSEYWNRIRTHNSFIFDAPMQSPNADAYCTVRNAVPDADAGSVVCCCAVPHLTMVPVRGRTRGSGPRSGSASQSSNRVPHPFLKLKYKKKHTRVHLKVARTRFSSKNIMFKIFLKLLCVTRTRIRILGSGSYQTKGECLRIRILEYGFGIFLCGPQIRIGSVPYGTDPLLRFQLGPSHVFVRVLWGLRIMTTP